MSKEVTKHLDQSFFFDWNADLPLPVPVTEQCETIRIRWNRGTATGPNPTAPYFLHVYTSTSIVPVVIPAGDSLSFDWAVPFEPRTQYQICMFDSNGATGGCQATYTVIQPQSRPTCANVTFPPELEVQATVINGPLSRYGWVDQCTDIQVEPKGGTPPYTFTIAPALHPPYNITAQEAKPMNWTVNLSWASPFFISLADAEGRMWSNGPLHSGGGGSIACLSQLPGSASTRSDNGVKPPIAIGAGAGGLVVGAILGLLISWFFFRRRYKKQMSSGRFVDMPSSPGNPNQALISENASHYQPVPSATNSSGLTHTLESSNSPSGQHFHHQPRLDHATSASSLNYHVEPFIMPDEEGRIHGREPRSPLTASHYSQSAAGHGQYLSSGQHYEPSLRPPPPQPPVPQPVASSNQVYVVHHDSQTPPVTIYHNDGTQIVELPPRYPPTSNPPSEIMTDLRSDNGRSDGSSEPPIELQQQRHPNTPRKSPRGPSS